MFLKFVLEYDNGKIQDSIYLNINCLHGSQLELKKTTLHILWNGNFSYLICFNHNCLIKNIQVF